MKEGMKRDVRRLMNSVLVVRSLSLVRSLSGGGLVVSLTYSSKSKTITIFESCRTLLIWYATVAGGTLAGLSRSELKDFLRNMGSSFLRDKAGTVTTKHDKNAGPLATTFTTNGYMVYENY